MAYLQFFPQAFIELQEELTHHPKLQAQLNENNLDINGDFVTLFSVITRHAGIDMVGEFTPQEIEKIAEICVQRLRSMRAPVIFLGS